MSNLNDNNQKHYNHTISVESPTMQRESLQIGHQIFHFSHDFMEKAKSYSESLNVRNLAIMEATLDEINNEIQRSIFGRQSINKLIHDLQEEIYLIKCSMRDLLWYYNHELSTVDYAENPNYESSYRKRTRMLRNKLIQLRKKEIKERHEKINLYQVDKAELLDWKNALKIYKRKHEVEIYELKQELDMMTEVLLDDNTELSDYDLNIGQIIEWSQKYSQEEIENAYKMLAEQNNADKI